MRACLLLALFAVSGTGCDRSAPLGTFTRNDVSKWASDCETSIVEENPRDVHVPGPLLRDGGPAFEHAAHRYRCRPPGWAIYTDRDSRIIGLCVDDEIRYSDGTQVSEIDRARMLITTHWGRKRATQMLQGVSTNDHCSRDTESISGMLRWRDSAFIYLDEPRMRSRDMCCWEVKN